MRGAYVKFFAALFAFLCEIGGAGKWMFRKVCSTGRWCGVAFVRRAFTAHNFCDGTEIELIIGRKLQKVLPCNSFARWSNQYKLLCVHAFAINGFYRSKQACFTFGRVNSFFASKRNGHFLAGFFTVFHAQLRSNIHAHVVEVVSSILKFIMPLLFKAKCVLRGAVLKWHKSKCTFAIFVPCILKMLVVVFVVAKRMPMFMSAVLQRTRSTSHVSRLVNYVQDHVNAGFSCVYVFHR